MTIYERLSILKVPFPFTDKSAAKMRPALLLSQPIFQKETRHVILAMITTAKNSAWPTDVNIIDLKNAGLPVPSVIRLKLFTLDERLVADCLGALDIKTEYSLDNKWANYFLFSHQQR